MPDIQTVKISLYRIDLAQEEIGEFPSIGQDTDLDEYVGELMEDIYESPRFKSFKFVSAESEVAKQSVLIDEESWVERSQVIAKRLLRIETIAQRKYQQITELRVGSILQILANVDGQKNLIITKIDHSAFLDEDSLKEKLGLPVKQRAQKTAIISFEGDQVDSIRVSDTNRTISEYWWQDFLEVVELQSSERNTTLAFNAIDRVLKRSVKPKSKSDFWGLRNAVISYFRTNQSCTYDGLVSSVFESYVPDSSDIDMGDLKEKIQSLPGKHKFDTQFEIDTSSISARIRSQIKLADNLELKITGELSDLPNLIQTGESDDGRKYIQIYSDSGYEEFHKHRDQVNENS